MLETGTKKLCIVFSGVINIQHSLETQNKSKIFEQNCSSFQKAFFLFYLSVIVFGLSI